MYTILNKIRKQSNIFKKNERILFVEIGFKLKIKLFHLYITVFTKLHREEINIWGWTGLFKDNATIQAFNQQEDTAIFTADAPDIL